MIFLRTAYGTPGPQAEGSDLWTVTANGATETNLANTPIAYECCAEYSLDGTKIAFTNNLDNGKHTFKVRATGPGGTDPSPASDGFKVKP